MSAFAIDRLKKEREEYKRDHPFNFVARPIKNPDDTLYNKLDDMGMWNTGTKRRKC